MNYPDDAPKHPWDEGKWIFPEDHPLALAERAARERYHRLQVTPGMELYAEDFKQAVFDAKELNP